MTVKRSLLLLSACLLAAGVASAQQPAGTAEAPSGNRQMYEDIEVMRRLLNRRLERGGVAVSEQEVLQRLLILNQRMSPATADPLFHKAQSGGTWTAPALSAVPVATPFEGVYLKGQGVVFTATLPPTKRDPRPADRVEAKPASEWDRVRKEIRGEKVEELSEADKKATPLAEMLLGVLAENGQHMSGLGNNEGVTVVVTFREIRHLRLWENVNFYDTKLADYAQQARTGSPVPTPPTPPAPPTPASFRDYELLADLHAKQGKHQEALAVLEKAILEAERTVNPPATDDLARLMHKVAQEFAATGAADKAKDWLDRAAKLKEKSEKTATRATPLPAKLILSAPKKLLDQAGAKKITFEEFKKAVTVEYLTFPPEEKKPEK